MIDLNHSRILAARPAAGWFLALLLLALDGQPAVAQLLPINGVNTFVKGANLAWLDGQYDHDIGINPLHPQWGCYYNAAHMNQYLGDMHTMGITVVRLWLNEGKQGLLLDGNGNVTGLDTTFLNNLDNIIQIATQDGIFLYLTLNQGDADWVTNTTKQTSYINNAVKPIAARYAGNPHIFAYDVMNEIDGVVGAPDGNHGSGATWAQAQTYISATVFAIHSSDPGRLATCSTGWNQWYNLGHFKGLGLDFYDYHDYEDVPSFPTASSLGMDKPIYIGECGQASSVLWDDAVQNNCELAALNSAWSGGYAGVGIWDYEFPGSPDVRSMVNPDASWRPVCYTIQNWIPGGGVWVDFSVVGPGAGTFGNPYNTLALGVANVPANGTVAIKGPSSTLATPTITKPLRIDAWGGQVSIGR
jgi:Cellulase (glycosyl hydrolase family 5)